MKLLAFVDLHGDMKYLKRIIKRAKDDDVDLVVAAGDLTNFEDHLRYIIRKLNTIGKKILIIQGNHESEKSMREAVKDYENCVYFDKKAVKIRDYIFLGSCFSSACTAFCNNN
jgi:Icc-related predicted phosphoesterase